MGKSKATKAAEVPQCRYGAACTRWDCIFKHPSKKERKEAASESAEKSDKVCFSFVAGRCAFGKLCHDRHPDEASCRTIRDRYNKIPCQWGKGCRTEGCLYLHPSDEQVGPAMSQEPRRPQPAVYAQGPRVAPPPSEGQARRPKAAPAQLPVPKAIQQAADLRDASAFGVADPLERFLAVNVHNSGSQSAALLDLHFQSAQTFQPVLDEVLPERLRMFAQGGVWVLTGGGQGSDALFAGVREYLSRRRYDFAVGAAADGQRAGFLVRGRARMQDPLAGVRLVLLSGLPGSGKTALAEALTRRSNGRFVCVSQDELRGGREATEAQLRRALKEAGAASEELQERAKAGSWWWDRAFSPDRYYLALCLRASALSGLRECGAPPLQGHGFVHATFAYSPTALDLRRLLGRPHRVRFRQYLALEATSGPHAGELFEVALCAARAADSDSSRPLVPLHFVLSAPRGAQGHLQVLNAIPLDKRIMANAPVGSFRVRQAVDLGAMRERSALCLLMGKAGNEKDSPAGVSFDAACLADRAAAAAEWSEVGDAALASLDPVVLLEEVRGASDQDWAQALAQRCAQLGLEPPRVQVSRPMGPSEGAPAQFGRLRPSCLVHCSSKEADAAQFLLQGRPVLRRSGAVSLPPMVEAGDSGAWPRVVILDRCNGEKSDRKKWISAAGVQKGEVVAVHLDVSDADCAARLAAAGKRHGVAVASSADAAAIVRPVAERFDPPSEREGFRAVMRLKGAAAAAQELARRWTEGVPAAALRASSGAAAAAETPEERARRLLDELDDEEAPAPELPLLKSWIEVEEQGGRRSVWGVPLGCPVDAPLEAPLEGLYGEEPEGAEPTDWWEPAAMEPEEYAAPEPPLEAEFVESPRGGRRFGEAALAAAAARWRASEEEGAAASSSAAPVDDEEALEMARQEQLAATLRCMGFDDEPSAQAAVRAGGNLNTAVESIMQSRGSDT